MNIKDEAVELKPCPFCASRVLNQFKDDDNHIIECAQCGCEIANTIAWKAIAAWNRRQSPAGVRVKPLEWSEDWSGGNEDIPCWRGKNPLGLNVQISFAGRLFDGRQIERHSEAPPEEVESAKAAKQVTYERRVLSALASPEPAPEPAKDGPEVVATAWKFMGERRVDFTVALDKREIEQGRVTEIEPLIRLSDYEALRAENERLRGALEASRQILAKFLSAGHNSPPATTEEIDAAFWSVDAALGGQSNE